MWNCFDISYGSSTHIWISLLPSIQLNITIQTVIRPLKMPSNESSTPQHLTIPIPDKGLSAEAVGELLQKQMAADIPPSHDLGR